MSYFSNPTANAAIGSVDRELKLMRKRALQLKKRRKFGLASPEEIAAARRQFTGIFRPLLRLALED